MYKQTLASYFDLLINKTIKYTVFNKKRGQQFIFKSNELESCDYGIDKDKEIKFPTAPKSEIVFRPVH